MNTTAPATERRHRRSAAPLRAACHQLRAEREKNGLMALVLGDSDGLCLARSGEPSVCIEAAAEMAIKSRCVENFEGVLHSSNGPMHVRTRVFELDGTQLFVGAVGGGGETRGRSLQNCIAAIRRILS